METEQNQNNEQDNSSNNTPKAEQAKERVRREPTQEELNNPFHGVKLKTILEELIRHYGWEYLGYKTNLNCFKYHPNVKSSLGFLRKTDWAREHVQDIYLDMLVAQKRLDPNKKHLYIKKTDF